MPTNLRRHRTIFKRIYSSLDEVMTLTSQMLEVWKWLLENDVKFPSSSKETLSEKDPLSSKCSQLLSTFVRFLLLDFLTLDRYLTYHGIWQKL